MNTDTPTATTPHIPTLGDEVVGVRLPDPSPLQNWWNEVMDGALTPDPGTA